MENPYGPSAVAKPIEKPVAELETEAAVEKMRSRRVLNFTSRKSSKTQRRYSSQRNVFSK